MTYTNLEHHQCSVCFHSVGYTSDDGNLLYGDVLFKDGFILCEGCQANEWIVKDGRCQHVPFETEYKHIFDRVDREIAELAPLEVV